MDLSFRLHSFIPPRRFFDGFPESEQWLSSRIKISLKFRAEDKWDKNSYRFLLDTGAYVSIAPDFILDNLNLKPNFVGFVHGIVDKEECEVKVKVAKICYKIIDDEGNESSELNSWFAFHSLHKGPLLFGMNGIFPRLGIIKKNDSNEIIIRI